MHDSVPRRRIDETIRNSFLKFLDFPSRNEAKLKSSDRMGNFLVTFVGFLLSRFSFSTIKQRASSRLIPNEKSGKTFLFMDFFATKSLQVATAVKRRATVRVNSDDDSMKI